MRTGMAAIHPDDNQSQSGYRRILETRWGCRALCTGQRIAELRTASDIDRVGRNPKTVL